jgi:hypothetical protein
MNLIKNLIARVEDYRKDNKNPCKNYATEARAEKVAEEVSKKLKEYFNENDINTVDYIVFYVPEWNRWTVAFDIKPWLNKYGGYMGIASEMGFFTF